MNKRKGEPYFGGFGLGKAEMNKNLNARPEQWGSATRMKVKESRQKRLDTRATGVKAGRSGLRSGWETEKGARVQEGGLRVYPGAGG